MGNRLIQCLFVLCVSQVSADEMTQLLTSVSINPQLKKFQDDNFSKPNFVKVSENVYTARSYEYSNFSFIVGSDGVIAVDSGWFPGQTRLALKKLRKITDKPIVALIYTHSHMDHTGGSSAITEESSEAVAVYAHANWNHYIKYRTGPLNSLVAKRARSQLGMVLPDDMLVGQGIGPRPSMNGSPQMKTPTHLVEKRKTLNISGVEIEIALAQGDIPEHMVIWLPKEKVLFSGDTLGGTFPYMESARYEPTRNPKAMVDTLDLALSLEPEAVVPGHGRVLLGENDVNDVLKSNRDVIQFLDNQVDRLILRGYSADEILETIEIPEALLKHPDLQAYYHRIDWMLRSMYAKRIGWNERVEDLSKLSDLEESRRLVKMLGGVNALLSSAQKSYEEDDFRWSLSLSRMALDVAPSNAQAMDIRSKAMLKISEITLSANERNYILTDLYVKNSDFNWSDSLYKSVMVYANRLTIEGIIKYLSVRIDPTKANGLTLFVTLDVADDEGVSRSHMTVRNKVLVFERDHQEIDGHVHLSMNKEALLMLSTGFLNWKEAERVKRVSCLAGCDQSNVFYNVFDRATH